MRFAELEPVGVVANHIRISGLGQATADRGVNGLGAKFRNVSDLAGPRFSKVYSARRLAVGGLNNDEYADVVFTENGGLPHILTEQCHGRKQPAGVDSEGDQV
jgi:hypothetical protein